MNSLPKLAKFIVGITISLLLLQVVVASHLTTAGLTLTKLFEEEKNLKEEKELLERKIATFSSLIQVAQKAESAGFVKPKTFYFTRELPIALEYFHVDTSR